MDNGAFDNIIFVGGIHGVGKTTICQQLASSLNLSYLSASEVLRWDDINADKKNKNVDNIPDTQNRLIAGLENIVQPRNKYILDGHFCLFDSEGIVSKIPLSTFEVVNPIQITVVTDNINEISARLRNRDKKNYPLKVLDYMQQSETEYAQEISEVLKIPFFRFDKSELDLDLKNLLSQLHESLA